ncbi:cytochrome P450 superfamily protein isoform X2 [Wolffia australiana]
MREGGWFLAPIWVIGGAAWWWWRWRKGREKEEERREKKIPKGSKGWPLIGETLDFIACGFSSRPVRFMDRRRDLYGKVFQTHLLGKAIAVSTDAEVNRAVLTSDGFVPSYPRSVAELLGKDSILQAEGALHRRVHGVIGGFLKSASAKAAVAAELEHCVLKSLSQWPQKGLVFVQDETKEITFPVLVKVLMGMGPGEDLDYLKDQFQEFVAGLICLPIKLPGTRLSRSLKAKEGVQRTINKIVQAKVQDGQYVMARDVVDVLINESITNKLTEMPTSLISSILAELMLPGEHSVPMMMTLAVKYLTDKPLALEKLREENLTLRRKKVNAGEPYTWSDYMSLNFTHHVINEALRMANIVNGVWRKAIKDIEIKGYLIPKDWSVLASFSSVHFDEQNYPDPYEFNPGRWEKGVCGSKFTPFGGGQRLCPGQDISRLEICIFLHHLVTRYSWVAEEDEIVSFPIVKMKKKMPIRVSPISF